MLLSDDVAQAVLRLYASLPRSCHPQPSGLNPTYTILAGIVLLRRASDEEPFVISLATGSKVLPASRLPVKGDVLHDCHAEVLARRGAVKWLYNELLSGREDWLERKEDRRWALREGIGVGMYVSCLPCGDASMSYLAATQDPEMASMKDATPATATGGLARGRDGYAKYGALRTKPGRADSPPTMSMSCSDKIASWTLLGIQGALLSSVLDSVYIEELVIGGVPPGLKDAARADCLRAFRDRLAGAADLPAPFKQHVPEVSFTDLPFSFSKEAVSAQYPSATIVCSPDSISWIAGMGPTEMLAGGIKRGASLKSKKGLRPSGRSRLCKLSLFADYIRLRKHLELAPLPDHTTYHTAKLCSSEAYTAAKRSLRNPGQPFASWVVSGRPWESFTVQGDITSESEAP